jgi:hypothetical protein
VLREFFEKYLNLTIKNYLLYKAAFDDQFKRWLDVGRNFSSIAGKSLPIAAPWQSLFDLFFNPERKAEKEDSQAQP